MVTKFKPRRGLFSILFVATVFINIVSAQTLGPLSYDQLTSAIQQLCAAHPDRCKLTIAQEVYGLPSPGMCGDKADKPCQTQILHITNFTTYEMTMETRPQVYISGELHGDERVGPHAALEYARLLLESDNTWIRKLVDTRSIFITPITNSLGFDRNTREEGIVDPNRDYPIDQQADSCMKAIASRIANELYRDHMFQLAITFHGGMEAIAMEWGTKSRVNHKLHKSPDDFALMQVAGGLTNFAGPVTANGRKYPVGRMNDLVYPVEGGMEDWAYAGNWDPDSKRVPCTPSTFGGYPASKTQYTDSMLRTVNILVETSNQKWPSAFGTAENILNPNSGTGHVPRNVRLALMLTDLVQPYVHVTAVRQFANGKITINWEVGGAFDVDETWAVMHIGSLTGKLIKQSSILSGKTRWATNTYGNRATWPFKSRFSTCFTIPAEVRSSVDSVVVLQVKAKVDSSWAMKGQADTVSPKGFKPQTHFVNARINPRWNKTNNGFRVEGRLEWSSDPLSIRVIPPPVEPSGRRILRRDLDVESTEKTATLEDNDEEDEQDVIRTAECQLAPGQIVNNNDGNPGRTVGFSSFIFSGMAFVAFSTVGCYMWRTRRVATHQKLATVDDS